MTGGTRHVALLLLAVLVGAGCGQAGASGGLGLEGTAITFSIKVDESERPAIQELLSRFQHQTRARVSLEQLSRFRKPLGPRVSLLTDVTAEGLVKRLREDQSQGKATVHLFAQDNVALSPLVDENLVQRLDALAPVPKEAIETLVPQPDAAGNRYFLPFRPNVRLAYGRDTEFRKAGVDEPTTEDELVSSARALKGSGQPKVTLSLADGDPAAVTVCELIVSHGGNPLVLNDAGSAQAFTFLQKLWRDGLLSPASFQAKWDTEVRNLADGTASLAENWSFTSAQLAKRGLLQDFFVYPGWSGPRQVHVIGGDVLAVPRGVRGKELRAAVALASFLMSKDSQELLARRNAWPSFRSDVNYRDLPQDQQATFSAIQTALAHGWYRPTVAYWPQLSRQLNKAVVTILLEGKPVQPVLDELHGQIQAAAASQGASYP